MRNRYGVSPKLLMQIAQFDTSIRRRICQADGFAKGRLAPKIKAYHAAWAHS
jgi:hypothetical protein